MQGSIDLGLLNSIDTVFYHGKCPDGIVAREVLKFVFGTEKVKYVPYYFEELKTIPENTLFVDCSPKQQQTEECLKNGCMILEHHESFRESFLGFSAKYSGTMLFGENGLAESGARLALHLLAIANPTVYKYTREEVLSLVGLIALSDTWQTHDPNFELARMYAKYITSFGNDFNIPLADLYDMELVVRLAGSAMQKHQKSLASAAIHYTNSGMKIAFINELNMSDAAEILRTEKSVDVIIGYVSKFDFGTNGNQTIYSMRSKEGGFDVSIFAKKNGGGGHKAAAGFSIPYEFGKDPIATFIELFSNANAE